MPLMFFQHGDDDGVQILRPPHLAGGWLCGLGWGVALGTDALGCGGAVVGLVGLSCLQKLFLTLDFFPSFILVSGFSFWEVLSLVFSFVIISS